MKNPGTPQHAIGVTVGGDMADVRRSEAKVRVWDDVCGSAENDIARQLKLPLKEDVGIDRPGLRLDGGMIVAMLTKENVQRDSSRSLSGQFANSPPIDVTGPIKAELQIGSKPGLAEDIDGVIGDENEPEVLMDWAGNFGGLAHAPIVSDPFKAAEGCERGKKSGQRLPCAGESNARQSNEQWDASPNP